MKVIIHGATGRMGQSLAALLAAGYPGAETAALVAPHAPEGGVARWYTELSRVTAPADCVVDFSVPAAAGKLLAFCLRRGLPLVLGTTGYGAEEESLLQAAAAELPIFRAANLSLGAALLEEFARRAAHLLPTADVEIVERHRRGKRDLPSGTALRLAGAIQSVRKEAPLLIGRQGGERGGEIALHSLRMGRETGSHEVLLSLGGETLSLAHSVGEREVFARGALAAAAFLQGKGPGIYGMEALLGAMEQEGKR